MHRPTAPLALVGLPQAYSGSGRRGCAMGQACNTVSSLDSCRRRQHKGLKGLGHNVQPGQLLEKPAQLSQRHSRRRHGILPAPPVSHPPAWDQRHKGKAAGLAGGARKVQPGLVLLIPMAPAGHLHKHYVHLQHFGGGRRNTPDECFTRAAGASVW